MTEHTPETTDPEQTAEERRAELPGLGYTDKFVHGEESLEQEPDEDPVEEESPGDGEPNHDAPPSPSPATMSPPPPATQPWTLGQNAGE